MSSSIPETLATLWLQVSDGTSTVKCAYADAPRSLAAADLPAVIVKIGAADFRGMPDDINYETGLYTCYLLVAPAQSGVPGEASAAVRGWQDQVRDFFAARPTLENARYILDDDENGLIHRGEPRTFRIADLEYLGVDFVFKFREMFRVNRAEG